MKSDTLFPNPVLAEGILDRLVNLAHHVILTGRSFGPLLRPDKGTTDGKEMAESEPAEGGETDVK